MVNLISVKLVKTLQWRIQDFPQGGAYLVGGRQLPRRLRFEKFVCPNEKNLDPWGGGAPTAPPGSSSALALDLKNKTNKSL